jgi:hypothetical protein
MGKKKVENTASTITPILLTLPDAARFLSCTVWAMRSLLWAKKVPYVKIGQRFLVDPADLRAYVERIKICR